MSTQSEMDLLLGPSTAPKPATWKPKPKPVKPLAPLVPVEGVFVSDLHRIGQMFKAAGRSYSHESTPNTTCILKPFFPDTGERWYFDRYGNEITKEQAALL